MPDRIPAGFKEICIRLNVDPKQAVAENWDEWRIWKAASRPLEERICEVCNVSTARMRKIEDLEQKLDNLERQQRPAERRLSSKVVTALRRRALADGLTPYQTAKLYEAYIFNDERKPPR